MRSGPVSSLIFILIFIVLVLWGVNTDLKDIPPHIAVHCNHDEVEQRAKADLSNAVTPPAVSYANTAQKQSTNKQETLFAWDQLPPRLGLGFNGSRDYETWARRLGAGWFIDWRVQLRHPTQLPEHWQMIRLGEDCIAPSEKAIRWVAARYPGNTWIIGNESDNLGQDTLLPEEYAQIYHRLYYLIKDADPTAAIATVGVTQVTPLRLAYLDRVLQAYRSFYGEAMPVDWWTVHVYIVREEKDVWGTGIPPGFQETSGILYGTVHAGRAEIFQQQIIDFRTWMAERGYRDKPLAITEFSIPLSYVFGYTPDIVAEYLWDTFTWLDQARDQQIGYPDDDNRLVQRWAWYGLYSRFYPTSNLADVPADGLTEIGQAYRTFAETYTK